MILKFKKLATEIKNRTTIGNSKGGYSSSISWIFGLVSLFGIGVLYIVFLQVFTAHLVPAIKNQVIATGTITNVTQMTIIGNIDKYMTFFNFLPFVLFGVVVIYMITVSFRKEQQENF